MQARKRSSLIYGAIILAASLGACTSAALTAAHLGGWGVESAGSSFFLRLCRLGAIESNTCTDVVDSRWGSFDVYLGSRRILVPTSLIGFTYFAAVLVWFSMLEKPRFWPRGLRHLTMGVLSVSMLTSISLIVDMAVNLQTWCRLCLIAHACNAVIVGLGVPYCYGCKTSGNDDGIGESAAQSLLALRRRVAWAVAVAVLGIAAGSWLHFDTALDARRQWRKLSEIRQAISALQHDRDFVLREYYAQPLQAIPTPTQHAQVVDRPTAPVLPSSHHIVVFTDYDCDGCACFDEQHEGLVFDTFGSVADIEIRHFPRRLVKVWRDRDSQVDLRTGENIPPSFAAEAARLQGGEQAFSQMHRFLFDHKEARNVRAYTAFAQQIGLDADRFLADMHGDKVGEVVRNDIALAQQLGVTDVPAVFLDGRRVPDLFAKAPTFWVAIANEMAANDSILASTE